LDDTTLGLDGPDTDLSCTANGLGDIAAGLGASAAVFDGGAGGKILALPVLLIGVFSIFCRFVCLAKISSSGRCLLFLVATEGTATFSEDGAGAGTSATVTGFATVTGDAAVEVDTEPLAGGEVDEGAVLLLSSVTFDDLSKVCFLAGISIPSPAGCSRRLRFTMFGLKDFLFFSIKLKKSSQSKVFVSFLKMRYFTDSYWYEIRHFLCKF
jgi:hypothetical protein